MYLTEILQALDGANRSVTTIVHGAQSGARHAVLGPVVVHRGSRVAQIWVWTVTDHHLARQNQF